MGNLSCGGPPSSQVVPRQADETKRSLSLCQGGALSHHLVVGAAGGHGGNNGLWPGGPMEKGVRPYFGHWLHRQPVQRLPHRPVLDEEVPGVSGAYGAV